LPTWVFEAFNVTIGTAKLVVIRLPDVVLDSPMKCGVVMARAEHEFGRWVLLLGEDKGRIVGNLHHTRLLQEHGFDAAQARWVPWSMVEPD
jgi:hypothetical protein